MKFRKKPVVIEAKPSLLHRLTVAAVRHADALVASRGPAFDDEEFLRADSDLIEVATQFASSLSPCDRKRLGGQRLG